MKYHFVGGDDAFTASKVEAAPLDLERETYLHSDEAAHYLGYRKPRYAAPVEAFMAMARRIGPKWLPRLRLGRRVVFARKDLDRCLRARVLHEPAGER